MPSSRSDFLQSVFVMQTTQESTSLQLGNPMLAWPPTTDLDTFQPPTPFPFLKRQANGER